MNDIDDDERPESINFDFQSYFSNIYLESNKNEGPFSLDDLDNNLSQHIAKISSNNRSYVNPYYYFNSSKVHIDSIKIGSSDAVIDRENNEWSINSTSTGNVTTKLFLYMIHTGLMWKPDSGDAVQLDLEYDLIDPNNDSSNDWHSDNIYISAPQARTANGVSEKKTVQLFFNSPPTLQGDLITLPYGYNGVAYLTSSELLEGFEDPNNTHTISIVDTSLSIDSGTFVKNGNIYIVTASGASYTISYTIVDDYC